MYNQTRIWVSQDPQEQAGEREYSTSLDVLHDYAIVI